MAQDYEVDVARYADITYTGQDITLVWEDPRDIYKVVVVCSEPTTLSNVRLQYWQNNWPHKRVPRGEAVGAGASGWMPQDDWFNGKWKDADIRVLLTGNEAARTVFPLVFKPINSREFRDIRDFRAVYRRTMKLRLLFPGGRPEIERIEAYTDSVWKETEVKIEWGEEFSEQRWTGALSAYNGEMLGVEPVAGGASVTSESTINGDGSRGAIRARLRFMHNDDVNSFDRTIVTFRSSAKSFSFLAEDIDSGERIFLKDFDVLATRDDLCISYEEFRKEWEIEHQQTLVDRIGKLPEQTFDKAWNDMPAKKSRGFMPLGCDGGRQKFAADENGDIFCQKNWIPRVKGRDTDRVLWDGREMRYTFGFPTIQADYRQLEDGYLPIIRSRWEADGVAYEQTAFATLLGADISSGERMQGDDPVLLMAKIELINLKDDTQTVSLVLGARCDRQEALFEKDGFVFAADYEPARMRYSLNTGDMGSLKSLDGNLIYEVELNGKGAHSIYIGIPFITLVEDGEYDLLKGTDYETEFERVKEFWQRRTSEGSQITVPNQTLNDFYEAHITHMLITDDREVGSDRYASRVGTFPYGAFPNESCMCISDFSRRGYKREAEERLELFVHYQGTVALPGNFTHKEGLYYGAGGYECGGYNQHHGWVLWALGEHYWYYRDDKWLKRVAPSIVKACDWIIDQRETTKRLDENGNKVLEYGFLPAGALEDVQEYYYWLSTNVYTWWGLKNAAEVLAEIEHPEAERLLKEALDYKEDLKRGHQVSMIRSPVVKLLNRTYVPHIPPRLYRRGRGFGWIRETLEGAIHLVRCELVGPEDPISSWIINDFEDNLYISDRYGYSVEDFERDWFSLGGFSMQSNLLCHPIPYLLRDEPKHFLRGYFNAFVSTFYPDICALVEHAAPTLADNNGVWFKPSDEAQSTFWLRLMLIHEHQNELNLAMAAPRAWFEDGKSIKIQRAMTYFGEMGYQITSDIGKNQITMVLDPPTRNAPEAINIRFRHPQEKPIRRVLIDGNESSHFDSREELIRLGRVTKSTRITAMY